MHIRTQRLSHFPTADVGNSMQSKAIVEFIMIKEILFDAIDNKMQKFVLLVEEEGNSKIADLLFRIFSRRYQVQCFKVAKVDVPSENIDVEQL